MNPATLAKPSITTWTCVLRFTPGSSISSVISSRTFIDSPPRPRRGQPDAGHERHPDQHAEEKAIPVRDHGPCLLGGWIAPRLRVTKMEISNKITIRTKKNA